MLVEQLNLIIGKNNNSHIDVISQCIDISTNILAEKELMLSELVIRVNFDDIEGVNTFSLSPKSNRAFYEAGKAAARKFLDSN